MTIVKRQPRVHLASVASPQVEIDQRMFKQSPIHIIERFLTCFATDGGMTFPVDQHILEALARRFRLFFDGKSLESLDEAFGGQTARQRQARHTADRQYEVAFMVIVERERLRRLKKAERGNGTPHELACVCVAQQLRMSVDNVRRLYKDSHPRKPRVPG